MPENEYKQNRGKVCENMSINHTSGKNHCLSETSPQYSTNPLYCPWLVEGWSGLHNDRYWESGYQEVPSQFLPVVQWENSWVEAIEVKQQSVHLYLDGWTPGETQWQTQSATSLTLELDFVWKPVCKPHKRSKPLSFWDFSSKCSSNALFCIWNIM